MNRKKGRATTVMDDTEEDVVTRIAWLYYKEKMTQAEIADRVSLSRQKVQRLLEKARDLALGIYGGAPHVLRGWPNLYIFGL